MAEEPETDIDIKETFQEAANRVREITSKLTEDQLLLFYGYYKQAVDGPCNRPKPSWYQMAEKQKWQAWSSLDDMGAEEAMRKYIDLLGSIDENWKLNQSEKAPAWIHHSSMKNTNEELEDSAKTIFDWVKEGNIAQVKALLSNGCDTTLFDEEGLNVLHWAADRGDLEIVMHLVKNINIDINTKDMDGQTALHYASSCGHEEVLKFLLESGADLSIKNCDGHTAKDVADSSNIQKILESF